MPTSVVENHLSKSVRIFSLKFYVDIIACHYELGGPFQICAN